jgi:chitinase
LQLLKELRQELDNAYPVDHKEISMAVHVKPFIKSGTPMTNVTEFVTYFDHINLMSYGRSFCLFFFFFWTYKFIYSHTSIIDINGAWTSETGPNAPFMAQQGKGAQFSFVDSKS